MRLRQWITVIALVLGGGLVGYLLRSSTLPESSSISAAGSNSPAAGFQGSRSEGSGQSFGGRSAAMGQGFRGQGQSGAAIPVQTATTHTGTLIAQRQAAGTVVPVQQSQVAAQSSGRVARVLLEVGDEVRADQPVIQLEDSQLRIAVQNAELALQNARISLSSQTNATREAEARLEQQLRAAQASLAAAQASYAAAQEVHRLGGMSESELQTVKSQLNTAQANLTAAQAALEQNKRASQESLAQLRLAVAQAQNQLRLAQLNLSNATIRAPFDGQIAAIAVAPGEAVSPSSQVFTLVSTARQVRFSVPPSDAPSLSLGQVLRFDTGSQSFEVKLSQRPAAPVGQNVNLTARFVGTATPPAGTVGSLSYSVRLAQGTLLPIAALQNDGARSYVYVVNEGKAKVQNVTVLAQAASTAAVRGLEGGLEVIVNPPPGLLDGSAVVSLDQTRDGSSPPGQRLRPGNQSSQPSRVPPAGGRP
ncbi:efflux RND transporter periplasmic adaptor subunit [Calidithermus timidus]|jgi:RND family efflux transporter MFP subunit|uniref:efflux RND transporter periplasmic adaptor subunit n=1 Tax=Calidithermus timidus TaxID=307124 RepID=UPI00036EA190|nr:efflux RND transporter periplasmic adaptor subunit [Calidithermus timidus]